ncbi:hypothetical protein [Lichenicoccus sp.]|uniref:hypothetical protein n=1 Tax=Lichenicoccus sp. TaxID=2781899 RepID=UPI003D126197
MTDPLQKRVGVLRVRLYAGLGQAVLDRSAMVPFFVAAAVILSGTALVGYSFSNPDPKVFINELYAPYIYGDHAYQIGRDLSEKFDGCLTYLLKLDNQQVLGDAGYVDWDPICNCQDFGNFSRLRIEQTNGSYEFRYLKATFRNLSKRETVRFTLVPVGRGWRIADISEAGMASLKRLLLNGYKDNSDHGGRIQSLCR